MRCSKNVSCWLSFSCYNIVSSFILFSCCRCSLIRKQSTNPIDWSIAKRWLVVSFGSLHLFAHRDSFLLFRFHITVAAHFIFNTIFANYGHIQRFTRLHFFVHLSCAESVVSLGFGSGYKFNMKQKKNKSNRKKREELSVCSHQGNWSERMCAYENNICARRFE